MQWQLWDILQENSLEHIQPNPPSSGMLGEITALWSSCSAYKSSSKCHFQSQLWIYVVWRLIRIAFTVLVLCQNSSIVFQKYQLGCVKVSSLQHPSGTAVTNVAWFHVGIGEQSAASRCSSGFLALKTRAVQPHGVQGGTYGSCGFRSHQGNKSVYCRWNLSGYLIRMWKKKHIAENKTRINEKLKKKLKQKRFNDKCIVGQYVCFSCWLLQFNWKMI